MKTKTDRVLQIIFSDGTPPIIGNDECLRYMLSMKKVFGSYSIFVESCDPDEEAMLKGILAVHGINVRTMNSRTILTSILTLVEE